MSGSEYSINAKMPPKMDEIYISKDQSQSQCGYLIVSCLPNRLRLDDCYHFGEQYYGIPYGGS
jgi:hypothetical protein